MAAVKKRIQQQIGQVRIPLNRITNILEKGGTNDAAAAPHQRDGSKVEIPVSVARNRLHELKPLCIGDDLGSVKCLLQIVDQHVAVARKTHVRS